MNKAENTHGLLSQLRRLPALGIFCVLLLFVQSAELIHSHQGDLQKQFDCEICLKVGSLDDGVLTAKFDFDAVTLQQVSASPATNPVISSTPPRQARAPPALS